MRQFDTCFGETMGKCRFSMLTGFKRSFLFCLFFLIFFSQLSNSHKRNKEFGDIRNTIQYYVNSQKSGIGDKCFVIRILLISPLQVVIVLVCCHGHFYRFGAYLYNSHPWIHTWQQVLILISCMCPQHTHMNHTVTEYLWQNEVAHDFQKSCVSNYRRKDLWLLSLPMVDW